MAAPALTSYSAATGQPINGGRWAGGRLSGDVALSAVAPAGTLGAQASDLSGNVALDAVAPGGEFSSLTPVEFDLIAAGGWTWFNDERALSTADYTFSSYNTGATGGMAALRYRHSDGQITSGVFSSGFTTDDHVVPTLVRLPSGTLMAYYCGNPDSYVRYRSSSAVDAVTSWSSVTTTPASPFPVVYCNPRRLPTSGVTALFSRCITDTADRRHYYITSANDGTSWGSWTEWLASATDAWPYLIVEQDGDRLWLLVTSDHPNEGASSVYAGYCEWNSGDGALRFYTMADVQLTPPFAPSAMTQVYDGSTTHGWILDIKIDGDGYPRVLFQKVSSSPYGADNRVMFSRWNGSAFTTAVDLLGASVGKGIGPTESNGDYIGGACFDGNDTDVVYLGVSGSGVYEMQKWRTSDNGATWAKTRDLSTGTASTYDNYRPVSPIGHPDELAVIWCQGTYPFYDSWTAKLRGANSAG